MSTATRSDTQAPAAHVADNHDLIRVQGARENNLKDISVEIPKRRLTVFTGVSGSGKSSLVFSTIAAESQRMINETYSSFVQGFMPTLARPDVDVLEGLTTAIIVDQERMGANSRSTVGTVTDANAMLRILFSRLGRPHIGSPQAFSFNIPTVQGSGAITMERGDAKTVTREFSQLGGMCPRCEGMGTVSDIDLHEIYDADKSLAEGAITVPGYTADGWSVRLFAESGFLDPEKQIRDYTEAELHDFLYREPVKVKVNGINLTYEGLIPKVQKSMLSKDVEAMQPHIRAFVQRAVAFTACPECGGTRLNEGARSSKIDGISIADACAMQISDLADWIARLDEPSVAPLLASLRQIFDSFVEIGLGYLSLDRSSGTLSGGEAQRTKMIRHLGSSLTDVTYVFDEPTIGLHPHDIQRMNDLLLQLRDKGNTVLVVEHKPEAIVIADHVVDLGPLAGSGGGEVVFEGTIADLRSSGTLTGRHLDDRAVLKDAVRTPSGALEIRGATENNLQAVDVDIPLGVLVVVTGVAGSGKSSLIHGSVSATRRRRVHRPGRHQGIPTEQPRHVHGTARADPQGVREGQRRQAGALQRELRGRLPELQRCRRHLHRPRARWPASRRPARSARASGSMHPCSTTTWAAATSARCSPMSVTEAEEFFRSGESRIPAAHAILQRLADVGLGYLTIGQPLTTLSGGERQRLKLATHMGEKGGVYILDEPTTGLHLADVDNLLGLLDRLVDAGKSVIVIEHHQAVMAHADWIIDLGPGAGHDGGRIVFEGTPADLVADRSTLTGEHLAAYVGS